MLRVEACAVCRTDLHVVDGELPEPALPLVPGHEIVGRVVERGDGADRFAVGLRVGVPWLGWTCGTCSFCRAGAENLCARAGFTGYTRQGGYAELTVADERFCFTSARCLRRRSCRAAALCGADRPSSLSAGDRASLRGRGRSGWPLRLRCGRASAGAGRGGGWPAGVRLHESRRRAGAGPRAPSGRGVGWRIERAVTRAARRRHHLRAGWRARTRGPSAPCGRAASSSAPAFT